MQLDAMEEYPGYVSSLDDFLKREQEQFRELGESFEEASLDDDNEASIILGKQEVEEEQEEFVRDRIKHSYSDIHDHNSLELQDIYEMDSEKEGVHGETLSKMLLTEEDETKRDPITPFMDEGENLSSEMFYKSKSPSLMTRVSSIRSMNKGEEEEIFEEPPAIKEWKERQKIWIEEKNAISAREKAKVLEEGQKALEEFYEEYNKKKTKNMTLNKEREELSRKDREHLSDKTATPWEQVCRYLDLNFKNNKTTKDLPRMRTLLVQLKNEKKNIMREGGDLGSSI